MSRTIPLDRYRNTGILASQDAGRTTTTERILAVTGRAASDEGIALAAGQDNGRHITLTTAATSCDWRGCRINLIDLPVAKRLTQSRSVGVLDGAVVVLDAGRGVTAEIASTLSYVEGRGIARLVFVNKLDQVGASVDGILADLEARATSTPVLLTLPIDAGAGLSGLIDVVTQRAAIWVNAGFDAQAEDGEIPAEFLAAAEAARGRIVDVVAPGLTSIDSAALAATLREAVRIGKVTPVLCGSAFRSRGIQHLLNAIVDYLPAPSDISLVTVSSDGVSIARNPSDDEPFTGLAFQAVDDATAGQLTFVRIFSGIVHKGSQILNSVTVSPERIGAMVRVFANHTESVDEARTGDIVGLVGLEHTTSGDTLCDPAIPVILERMPVAAGA